MQAVAQPPSSVIDAGVETTLSIKLGVAAGKIIDSMAEKMRGNGHDVRAFEREAQARVKAIMARAAIDAIEAINDAYRRSAR